MIVFIHVNIRFIILEYSKICQANLQKNEMCYYCSQLPKFVAAMHCLNVILCTSNITTQSKIKIMLLSDLRY